MHSFAKHFFYIAIATGFIAGVRYFLLDVYSEERRLISVQAREQRIRQLASVWSSFQYLELPPHAAAAQITNQVGRTLAHLSEHQRNSLSPCLENLFNYLQLPVFERYYDLKTTHLAWELSTSAATNESSVLASSRESVRLIWDTRRDAKIARDAKLTSICVTNISCKAATTDDPSTIMQGATTKGLTVARIGLDSGIRYPGLRNRGTAQAFLHFSLFVRSNVSQDGGPLYFSLAWSDTDKAWIVTRIITDSLLGVLLFS